MLTIRSLSWVLKTMAKGIKFKRKELNQPDQFISTTDVLLAYCSKHKTGLTSIVLIVLLVIFSGFWFKYNQNITSLKMESIYFQMEQIINENNTNPKVKLKQIENLVNKFDEGPQKKRAILILADQHYDSQLYDRAIALYQNILAETAPTNLHYQLAAAGIAYSLEGKKDYSGAILKYKSIIESPSTFPLFHIFLSLARCYESNNDRNSALLTLREMNGRFSKHSKLDLVKTRIKKLEKLI